MKVAELKADDPDWFPPLESSITIQGQDGLLAFGGDLSPNRLLAAYRQGIFPWYDEGGPILWWAPRQRAVIHCDRVHVSKSMRRVINRKHLRVSWNEVFTDVIQECSLPRHRHDGVWILPEMIHAYTELHRIGKAESCEVWSEDRLVGGIYGVTIGRVFFGESMFSLEPNASKLALISVAQAGRFELIDCQFPSDHLLSMGAEMISRNEFCRVIGSVD